MKRAMEEGFPIVEINRLAVPERSAFKPIYQMHKWFARRASCVFRAILLGCLKPAGTDIMAEFYKDHTNDPDTVGKVILDPFMGGGTTVVEVLRLGCKVIGIDLNPVAWFIVKTEVEPVDLNELRAAFDRLANRPVAWSGKSVRETLLEQYKTTCPCCGKTDADIIYTFWVKSAVCTNAAPPCEKKTLVPLFSDYLVTQKSPSIRYWRDARCPRCEKTFDWEVEPATLIAEPDLMISSPTYSAGVGRTTTRWADSSGQTVQCPWCREKVTPRPSKARLERKKVPLSVLLCPFCEGVWQWRGDLPDQATCPVCHRTYKPNEGNVPDKGKFTCFTCGTKDAIIQSIRQLPEDKLLPMHPYAIQGYCAKCAGDGADDEEEEPDLLGHRQKRIIAKAEPDHPCYLTKSSGKFFTRLRPADLARYQTACARWQQEKDRLPYPKSEIPWGEKTKSGLIAHHYRYWHQMFTPRQLLCISTLLSAISEEANPTLKEWLLGAFMMTAEANNVFTWQIKSRSTPGGMAPGGVLRRHDFQPKLTFCEQSVFGVVSGNNTWRNRERMALEGAQFAQAVWDNKVGATGEKTQKIPSAETFSRPDRATLSAADARVFPRDVRGIADLIVTDPPYGGNVNYAELSDFFYVWLRLVLSKNYPQFAPEYTPKAEEIIENPTRGKTLEDFRNDLAEAFARCHDALRPDGLMVFTFHHAEGETWVALLQALCDAGFEIDSVYPIHGEREASLHLLEKEAIAYDLIHLCRKRGADANVERRSWAGIRQEIRRRARQEIQAIEAGRYGKGLSLADINIILIGKCLELYSRHYGAVVDHEENPVDLRDALKDIRSLVDQLLTKEEPLPSELEDIDPESRIYFLTLCDRKEIKIDEVHKATRGILDPEDLMAAGLIIKGRAGRGRTYEVKQPVERFQSLLAKFRAEPSSQPDFFEGGRPKSKGRHYFIDYLHLLMALTEGGEPLMPWLERFRGETPRLRAACGYLATRNKTFAPVLKKIRDLLDVGPLFK